MLVPDHPMPEIKKRSKFWPRLRMGLFFFSIAYMLLSFGITWHLIFGIKRSFVSHPSRRGIPATDVEFRAEDGKTIRGWLSEIEHRPTVIMAHGNGGYRAELAAVYQHVSLKVGLGFLTFDFRAAGQSDGRFSSYGIEESKDLRAAIQFLRNRGKPWKQIGLVAYDMGGVAAMLCAEEVNKLGAVVLIGVAENPYKQLGRRLAKYKLPLHPTASLALGVVYLINWQSLDQPRMGQAFARLSSVPVLMLGGEDDQIAPPIAMRVAYGRIPHASKRLFLAPGVDHEMLIDFDQATVLREMGNFLRQRLPY